MSDFSPNLNLPYLAQGQAQKHVTVNESIQRLDALVQLAVASAATAAEPGAPSDGAIYILPPGKTGAHWGGMSNHALAYYRDGAWEEIAPRGGWLAYVIDTGHMLCFDGAVWAPLAHAAQGWRVLASSGVAASHTGDTLDTTLATVAVPAGAMGPNGALRITALWSWTNSANTKRLRFYLGGAAVSAVNVTTNGALALQRLLQNRNSPASQVAFQTGVTNSFAVGSVASTLSVNTSLAQDLTFTGGLVDSGETITLESYLVEMSYGA